MRGFAVLLTTATLAGLGAAPMSDAAAQQPSAPATRAATAPSPKRYDNLVALFTEWRAFQRPALVDGVPDYSAARWPRSSAGSPPAGGARRDRHDGLAHARAGGLAHRARRDERARLRSTRAAAVGEQPGLLRHRLRRRRAISRRARGRRPPARSRSGATRFRSPREAAAKLAPDCARSPRSSRRRGRTWSATAATCGRSARAPCASRVATLAELLRGSEAAQPAALRADVRRAKAATELRGVGRGEGDVKDADRRASASRTTTGT